MVFPVVAALKRQVKRYHYVSRLIQYYHNLLETDPAGCLKQNRNERKHFLQNIKALYSPLFPYYLSVANLHILGSAYITEDVFRFHVLSLHSIPDSFIPRPVSYTHLDVYKRQLIGYLKQVL